MSDPEFVEQNCGAIFFAIFLLNLKWLQLLLFDSLKGSMPTNHLQTIPNLKTSGRNKGLGHVLSFTQNICQKFNFWQQAGNHICDVF